MSKVKCRQRLVVGRAGSRECGIARGWGMLHLGMEWKRGLLSEETWDLGFGIWGGRWFWDGERRERTSCTLSLVGSVVLLRQVEEGSFGWGVIAVPVPVPVAVGGSSHRLRWDRGDAR